MTRMWHTLIVLLAFCAAFLTQTDAKNEESFKDKVVVIKIGEDSLLSKQSFSYMTRIIKKASDEKAAAIVLDMDTPGGLAMETSDMMMKVLQPIEIPTIAYVNPKAMSAGALISAACDTIYMAPHSAIGAAGLVSSSGETIDPMMRKKIESAFTAFTRTVMESKGRNVELIKSMMIPNEEDVEFNETVKLPKGELLTLTAKEAVSLDHDGKPLLAKGIAPSINELLASEKINVPVIEAQPTGFEQLALWIATISPILILLGIGGIYLEFKTPGFGIGGIVAIIAFSLFFFGNYVAGNLAGYEMAALLVLGIILIALEFFVLPGTFIPGIIGAILVVIALFGSMISKVEVDHLISSGDWSTVDILGIITWPLFKLSIGLLGASILIMLIMRYLPDTKMFKRIANEAISGGKKDGEAVSTASPLAIGATGIAMTELKPNGKALINGYTYEVFSRDGILLKDTPVRVIEKRSFDFVVEKAEPVPADDSAPGEEE